MAITGIGNTVNPYIPAEIKGAKATKTYDETQPANDEINPTQKPSGGILGEEQVFPADSSSKDKVGLWGNDKTKDTNKFEATTSKPSDNSGELMQRLVTALGQFQVRQVISEANKSLMSLRMMAAISKGEDAALARACIKKMEKVLSRANRKLDDLDKEDMLKFQQARAEKQKQEQRAEEIKEELRKKENERRARESSYLLGDWQLGAGNAKYIPAINQKTESEAAIIAQAEAIAAAEMAIGSMGAADVGGAAEVSAGVSAVADSGTAAVSVEGGESAE